jgi:phage protein D
MQRHNPVLMVTANGRSLTDPDKPDTISLEHTEKGDGGKEAKLRITNRGLEYLDHPDVQEGRKLEWAFGYPGNLSPVYTATIFVTEPNFDAYGGLDLTIYAYDAVANAVWQTRHKTWRDPHDEAEITHSEVVSLVAAENGWRAVVEPTAVYQTEFHQDGISDWVFLHDVLAPAAVAADPEKQGAYRVWLDNDSNTLYFMPANLSERPTRVYHFMTENEDPLLLRFRPRVNTNKPDAQAGESATATDVDGSGRVVEGTADVRTETGQYRMDAVGRTYSFEEFPAGSDPAMQARSTSEAASGQADATQAKAQLEYLEAEITVIGEPYIRANDIVTVWNVGSKFSGRYLVDEVTHSVGPHGFITEISGKKDALPADATGEAEQTGSSDTTSQDTQEKTEGRHEFDAPLREIRGP